MLRAAKRARLRHLQAAGISDAKLINIIRRLREDEGLLNEVDISRNALRRSLDDLWESVGYDEPLAQQDDKGPDPFLWSCISLPKLLQLICTESGQFQTALRHAFQARPSTPDSPLRLILYTDEVVPGNVLRLDNRRKILCVYVSVKEFGSTLLKHECMWLPIALIRSSVMKDLKGAASACIKALLRTWFLKDKLSTEGVLVDLAIPSSQFARLYF